MVTQDPEELRRTDQRRSLLRARAERVSLILRQAINAQTLVEMERLHLLAEDVLSGRMGPNAT